MKIKRLEANIGLHLLNLVKLKCFLLNSRKDLGIIHSNNIVCQIQGTCLLESQLTPGGWDRRILGAQESKANGGNITKNLPQKQKH